MNITGRNPIKPVQWLGNVCTVALLSSCSAKPEKKIVGKWKEIAGTETMEFSGNGDVRIADKGTGLVGSSKFMG
jgi:hypothetical protein